MNYSRNCSCCGGYIAKEQIEFLKSTGEYDSEGNHCDSCYQEIAMNNQLQLMETIDMVAKSLSPLNRFKFVHKSFDAKAADIFRLMEKGYIKWQIG